jgi:2-dehydropantoate 2-reductase
MTPGVNGDSGEQGRAGGVSPLMPAEIRGLMPPARRDVSTVTIVGAGGIGCAVGYLLRALGVHVTFVEADHAKVRWGRTHGVAIDGRSPLPAVFVPFDRWRPGPDVLVLLCTKAYDNPQVQARLPATAQVLPIQNGFDPALPVRPGALEGIASFVSECLPGRTHTRLTRGGRLHFGRRCGISTEAERPPELPALLRRLAANRHPLARRGIRVEVVPDILPYKYTKLMYNAAISPIAAAAGLDNGALLAVPKARRLFFELLRENYSILTAAGLTLGTIGPFSPHTVQRILARPLVAGALSWAFYPTLRGTYCSMSGDLPAGRTEIDAYNGFLLRLAGDRPAPLNRRVHALVKRMEQERLPPGPHVLDELLS